MADYEVQGHMVQAMERPIVPVPFYIPHHCTYPSALAGKHQPSTWRVNLTIITYGIASAPYLALRTLQKLVEDEGAPYPAESHALRRSTHVDDIVLSVKSVEEAVK
ncbi:hypothetical protein J437_LFUL001607 [Ladona fulva]|uniref:Uncharacterized protein n=1 Tax=Ladona fulva TaxID=123851 RepID=A0A8K0P8P4_LADFU|nr:hypothetical protein J437_LFUL001607 [Ladona fulva]